MFLSEWREFSSAHCLAGKETWWQLASRFCCNRARPWHASELVSFLVGLRTYQHPGTEWANEDFMALLEVLYRYLCGGIQRDHYNFLTRLSLAGQCFKTDRCLHQFGILTDWANFLSMTYCSIACP